jgi:RHS repeat-associated protein
MNAGQSYAQTSKVHQELDGNGNVTIKKVYDYGNLTTPIRIYNYSYLSSTPYVNAYVRNRLTSATVTDGNGSNLVTLTSNSYDGTTCANATPLPNTSQATLHDTTYNTLSGVYRGNLTLQTTPQGYTCTLYDYLGNTYFTKAPHAPAVGVVTAGGNNGSNYSLPSQVTPNSNTSLSASLTYTGSFAPSGFLGPNGQVASADYDAYGRVIDSTSVDGARTTYTYSGPGVLPMTQMAQPSIYDPYGNVNVPHRWTLTTLDGLGRPVSVQSGPPGTTTAQTETDTGYGPCACSPTGKMIQTSQPYTPGATVYWTRYTYDGLGRTLTVQAPDGASTISSIYQGNTVQVTDPAGKWKKTASDMQGNTVQVTEPDPGGGSGLITNYTYDVMEHLTQVSMPRGSVTQTRTFHYDSGTHLLTSETHPETGTTSYTYYTAGSPDPATYDLLYSKTDAKGQVTKYDYDAYDRVTAAHRMPNGTTEDVCQKVAYTYDATPGTISGFVGQNTWGHVAAVTMGDPTACQVTVEGSYTVPQQFSEFYSYNVAGHVTTKRLELDQANGAGGAPGSFLGQWWDVGYTFNALGQMVTTSYPGTGGSYPSTGGGTAGQTYTLNYDNMDRPANLKDSRTGSPSTVSGVLYNAADQPIQTQFQLSGGYLWENRGYNALNQLTALNNFNTSATVVNGTVGLTYTYSATQNNGQITGGTTGGGSVTDTFTYDALKRLTGATAVMSTGATQWSQTYSYDGFGNMTGKQGSGATFSNPGLDQTTNRLVGTNVCYDGAGNLTSDQNGGGCGNPNYGYDATNRMVSAVVSGGTEHYIYDADNKRISTINKSGGQTVFIYGAMGEKLSVLPSIGSIFGSSVSNNVYFSGRLIKQGTDLLSGGGDLGTDTNFVAVDRLGSVKANYGASGTAYLPYGEEFNLSSNDRIKFATYTRDASTGLDYADQRFYTSQFGRFMSADRFQQTPKANDSGSWNKYAYTRNDPANSLDPTGMDDCSADFCAVGIGYGDPYGGFGGSGASGGGGGGGKSPFAKAVNNLSFAEAALQDASIPIPCVNDLQAIDASRSADQRAGSALDVFDVASTENFKNGVGSADPLSALYADPTASRAAGQGTIGAKFALNPLGLTALTVLGTGTAQPGTIYINPLLISNNLQNNESLLLHEALHSLGFDDADLQSALNLKVDPNNTRNITQKLLTDCIKKH